jgi:hypothetical protein
MRTDAPVDIVMALTEIPQLCSSKFPTRRRYSA